MTLATRRLTQWQAQGLGTSDPRGQTPLGKQVVAMLETCPWLFVLGTACMLTATGRLSSGMRGLETTLR